MSDTRTLKAIIAEAKRRDGLGVWERHEPIIEAVRRAAEVARDATKKCDICPSYACHEVSGNAILADAGLDGQPIKHSGPVAADCPACQAEKAKG